MASMFKSGPGWMIQWGDGNATSGRRSVRLPKMPRKDAGSILAHVEEILAARAGGYAVPIDDMKWAADLPDALYNKLSGAVGLLPKRSSSTLEVFIDIYVNRRVDVKPATKEVWRQGKMGLVNFFGANRPLSEITPGDADGYKLHLVGGTGAHDDPEAVAVCQDDLSRGGAVQAHPGQPLYRREYAGVDAGQDALHLPRGHQEDPGGLPFTGLAVDCRAVSIRWDAVPERSALPEAD